MNERYWRSVLRAYPAWYRAERREEVLGVLAESEVRHPVGETASLLRHGLALRLRDPRRRDLWRPAQGVAGLVLAVVMGTYGVWLAYAAGQAAAMLRWHPDPTSVPWVDPMWHVGGCWTLAMLLVLCGRTRLGAAAAWLGVAAHVALLLGAFGNEESLAYVDGTYRTVAVLQVAPTLVLAVLLLRARSVRAALDDVGQRLPAACALVAVPALVGVDRLGGDWQVVAIVGGVVALVVMQRLGVLLRASLAAFSGVAVIVVVQVAYQASWFAHPVRATAVVLLVTAALLLGALAVGRYAESSRPLRQWVAGRLETLARVVRPAGGATH